jgi:hypothetical protein
MRLFKKKTPKEPECYEYDIGDLIKDYLKNQKELEKVRGIMEKIQYTGTLDNDKKLNKSELEGVLIDNSGDYDDYPNYSIGHFNINYELQEYLGKKVKLTIELIDKEVIWEK